MMTLAFRLRRVWVLWRLRRLEQRIDPARFDPELSAKIDGCVASLDSLRLPWENAP